MLYGLRFTYHQEHLGVIWPKKVNMKQMKCIDRIELICTDAGEALFFRLDSLQL